MSKNLIIDGQIYKGVTELKAKDADSGELLSFLDTSDANAMPNDIKAGKTAYVNGVKINGTNTGVEPNDIDGIVDGSIKDFIMPSGQTVIAPYRFYNFSSMKSANLGGATNIGNHAFYYCRSIDNIVLPKTLTQIGEYAFYYLGADKSTFSFTPESPCEIKDSAFKESKISILKGKFSKIATNAFSTCRHLIDIDIEVPNIEYGAFSACSTVKSLVCRVKGAIENYAFQNLLQVEKCDISESIITKLGGYAFSAFGGMRVNPESNIITLDFRKSIFAEIPSYSLGTSSSSYRNKYLKILLPVSVSTIQQYAFRYTDFCDIYFYNEIPPTLSATSAWDNATNYNIFVPYNAVNKYRTATNWVAQNSYIKGFSPPGSFNTGDLLPELNTEGYELTWFSDPNCTITTTKVHDANIEYYCLVGTEKVAYRIESAFAFNCDIDISDNEKKYFEGDMVRINSVITITGKPTNNAVLPYMFKVNGIDFTTGESVIVNSDLSIMAIYYDGQTIPINPTFSENNWDIIHQVFSYGVAPQFWKVGDVKLVTLTDGNTYTIRITDMQSGRYELSNGGFSNGVFEFVECLPTKYPFNESIKENSWTGGGWAASDMKNIYMENIFDMLPSDIKAAIGEIKLNEYSYTSSLPTMSKNKLFLPAESEIYKASYSSAEGQGVYPKFKQYDWYSLITVADNASCADRQKYTIREPSFSSEWWLRSPLYNTSSYVCSVNRTGARYSNGANTTNSIAPVFAI